MPKTGKEPGKSEHCPTNAGKKLQDTDSIYNIQQTEVQNNLKDNVSQAHAPQTKFRPSG